MFLRLVREREGKELLVNVDHIALIEVTYEIPPDAPGEQIQVAPSERAGHPEAVRVYRVLVGNELLSIPTDPKNAALKAIEQVYRDAVM